MKKHQILFFAIFFSFFQVISNAQAKFGILAGPHSATIFESNSVPGWFNVKGFYSSRFSFHGGVVLDVPFSAKSPVHFQPALMYSGKGRKFEPSATFDTVDRNHYVHQEQITNYLDLPLNIVLKFPIGKTSRFIFGGGPQFSFLMGGKEITRVKEDGSNVGDENSLEKGSDNGQYKPLDFNLNGLIGFEFGRVFLTVNYSRGFSNFYKAKTYDATFRHVVVGGTIGIFFGKPRDGKARDRDKDGVTDDIDGCPKEAGTTATNGCPDKDSDGTPDKTDKCPDQAGPANNGGCPIPDKDGDGVPDDQDKCPDKAGLQIYEGCPIPDKDNDGVNDFEDRCPTVAGPASNKGCPIADADNDGIPDKDDKCPNKAGIAKYSGCPVPDSDSDGLNDDNDKCPYTKGTKENGGCPVVNAETITKIMDAAQQIKFASLKADLLTPSYKVLDQVVKLMKQNPSLTLTIDNYTNVLKTNEANLKLAVERANNIMAYIGLQGIDWKRMKANGFATEIQPPNSTEKISGNRTEFKVTNGY